MENNTIPAEIEKAIAAALHNDHHHFTQELRNVIKKHFDEMQRKINELENQLSFKEVKQTKKSK